MILEENEFFIVIDKPAGVSVHNQTPSVAEHLSALKKPLHFVNRLDQETSGIMIVAQKPELHDALNKALDEGEKVYRALLRSPWKQTEKNLDWKWAISDKAEGWKNPQGLTSDRKPAETKIVVSRTNQYFTEIEATLMTGRQHQIRKHAALAKHPIVGDKRYNEQKYNEQIARFYQNQRMLLHAERLSFNFNGRSYLFESPFDLETFFKT